MLEIRIQIKTQNHRRKGQQSIDSEVERAVKRALAKNIEAKVTYTTQQGGIDYNGSVFNMTSAIARSDNANDGFTGNLILPKCLTIRWAVSTNQTFSRMRLLVFQWKDASSPVPGGILNTIGSAIAPHSPLLLSNKHKVHVLHDEIISLFPVAGSYAVVTGVIQCTGSLARVQFATGSTLIQMNGLFLLAISDDGAPVYPQLDFISELCYTDA